MKSIITEIERLRKGKPIIIDYNNTNIYRLVIKENDGSRTAYYFSTPIYNRKNRKLLDVEFHSNGDNIYAVGSNANITISENIFMENAEGWCTIQLTNRPQIISEQEVISGNSFIQPTTNGVAIKYDVRNNEKISFTIEVDKPFLNVRANDKCFALMKEPFRPFVIFSLLGSMDASGNVIAPAKLEYQRITDNKYLITVSSTNSNAQYVLLESNLYENKLIQDTTVESSNPLTNNAFGSVGFIGNSSEHGVQWLYSRLDFSRMSEIMDKHIIKAIFHIPKLNHNDVDLTACKVSTRFCSFGSNWDNKIPGGATISDSLFNNGYQSLDFMPLLVDKRYSSIIKSDGMILKPKIKGSGFSVITTGDSCYAPQILEINYI